MHSLINLFKSYFNKFNEKTLKSNFVIIYELLDEVCDNGYPQITSPEVLKAFITQRAARAADDPKDTYENQRKAKEVSMQVTGAVQWRFKPPSTVHSSKERRRPLLLRPFWTVTEPAPCPLVPLSGFLASRRREQRKNGEKTSKNGRDMA